MCDGGGFSQIKRFVDCDLLWDRYYVEKILRSQAGIVVVTVEILQIEV